MVVFDLGVNLFFKMPINWHSIIRIDQFTKLILLAN
jgi:hypothetical protein